MKCRCGVRRVARAGGEAHQGSGPSAPTLASPGASAERVTVMAPPNPTAPAAVGTGERQATAQPAIAGHDKTADDMAPPREMTTGDTGLPHEMTTGDKSFQGR